MDKIKVYLSIINKKVLCILFLISAFISMDISRGLNEYIQYNFPNEKINACDIIFLSIFGINSNDISIVDLIRWLLPFILILYFVSIFISTILNNKLKLMWIIRCRSYRERIVTIYKYILFLSFSYVAFFFISIIVISILISGNFNRTSEVFLSINSDMQVGSLGIKYIIIQFFLSVTSISIIILISCIISFLLKDEIKGKAISIFILLLLGVLGKFDIPNIFMISRTSLINTNIGISVSGILAINIMLIILLSYIFIKLNDHSGKEL